MQAVVPVRGDGAVWEVGTDLEALRWEVRLRKWDVALHQVWQQEQCKLFKCLKTVCNLILQQEFCLFVCFYNRELKIH